MEASILRFSGKMVLEINKDPSIHPAIEIFFRISQSEAVKINQSVFASNSRAHNDHFNSLVPLFRIDGKTLYDHPRQKGGMLRSRVRHFRWI